MQDFIFFMHDDASAAEALHDWDAYLEGLRKAGVFQGGSGVGEGACFRKRGEAPAVTGKIVGYIRVYAEDLEGARALLAGNPVYEAGGTVEIRLLPKG